MTGVQTCALPISTMAAALGSPPLNTVLTDELLIVDDIALSNATHFAQPLGYAEAIDK